MSDGLAKGYDWWFRRGQATIAGTQEGKRNEMIHDTLVETQRQSGDLTAIREALTSNNGSSAVVESNREMLRVQERAREESSRLAEIQFQQQTQIANSFQGLSDDIAGFREDFRAVSVREHQMAAERNQFLSDIAAENHQQTGVMMDMNRNVVDGMNHVGARIDDQTKHLLGVAPTSVSSSLVNESILTLVALQQQGALSPEGAALLRKSNVAQLGASIQRAQSEVKSAEERLGAAKKNLQSATDPWWKDHYKNDIDACDKSLTGSRQRLVEIESKQSKLSAGDALAFQALYNGAQVPLDVNASLPALRHLAAGHALNPAAQMSLMKHDPESRVQGGLTGLNISAIETNAILKQGLGAIIGKFDGFTDKVCGELGIQREIMIRSTELMVAGMTTLDSNMRQGFTALQTTVSNEAQITRDVTVQVGQALDSRMQVEGAAMRHAIAQSTDIIGHVIQNGVAVLSGNIASGFEVTNSNLQKMSSALVRGLQVVDTNIRNGFFAVSEQMAKEGTASRETTIKAAEYVAQVVTAGYQAIHKDLTEGFQALDKRTQYANYLSEILVQEALKSNGLLNGIGNELMVLNRNVLEGRMEGMLQHAQLLDALAYYDNQTAVRHSEHIGHLVRVEDILVGVRDGVGKIEHELATKEKEFLRKYHAAENYRMGGFIDDAISVYKAIIAPDACPDHYASHIALVDCYLLKGDFETAIEHAKKAKLHAHDRPDLIEESHVVEVGIRYSLAEKETDEEKKQRMFKEMIVFFESLKGVSNTAKLFHCGALYKVGLRDTALKGLAELIRVDRFAIFDIRNVTPFEDFFKGDHLAFFRKEVLESNVKFPSEVYMYMFRIYEAAQDEEAMKLALKKAVEKRPSACMEAKIFNSPMGQALEPDLQKSVEANKDTAYKGHDLIAFYYLVKRFNLSFLREIRMKVVEELNMNQSLKGVKSLFRLSIILGEDFLDYYKLYLKKYSNT